MAYQTNYDLNQAPGLPGMIGDMENWNGFTRTGTGAIAFGAPVQRAGNQGCAPYASGGEYIGLARMRHFAHSGTDGYGTGDNVAVIDEAGRFGCIADAAIAVGVAINWNTATSRWTTAATSGTVLAVPGIEADTAATGSGSFFWARVRRVPA